MPPIARAAHYQSNCGDGKSVARALSFRSSFLVSAVSLFVIPSEVEESLLLMRIRSDVSRPIPGGACLRNVTEKTAKQGENGDEKYQVSDDVLSWQ
jgi:hypothetical protein